ncbi:SDR family oxidoreductase [Streptomyces sp. A7024]|uniref:SDR family oxidoreductase n=1 Tax=Streptomyces coryli TaxID=1128680 RepID=A0A6G4TSB2_9ACTN|nr:SDR family oxidoreductase [Streptomyces coryli]NGN62683.1 SDR family oxidoreductase [Streptomyces coryli]
MSSRRRTVLITGASRGLGRATAVRLAAAGWEVLAGVRDPDAGKALAAESPQITPVELDVTDAAQLAGLPDRLPPRLDALVNNAGIGMAGPVEAVPLEDVRRQFEVNVIGQLAVTQAALPHLRAARGHIVFVSSINGRVAIPMSGPYNASKAALESLADNLRVELRPWGIEVVLIEPGIHDTDPWRQMLDLLDETAAALSPEHRDLYAGHIAAQRTMCAKLQQRTAPPRNVAAAVERVLNTARPRARRLVGNDARILNAMRAALPTRVLDAVWARNMGLRKPGRASS